MQTVLTKQQYAHLLKSTEHGQKSLSVLIREAIEAHYFAPLEVEKRQKALANLLALEAPVADWEQMEAEIEMGALDG